MLLVVSHSKSYGLAKTGSATALIFLDEWRSLMVIYLLCFYVPFDEMVIGKSVRVWPRSSYHSTLHRSTEDDSRRQSSRIHVDIEILFYV